MAKVPSRIELSIRVILYVALFFIVLGGAILFCLNSEKTAELSLKFIGSRLESKGFNVTLSDIKGTFYKGILIDQLKVSKKNSLESYSISCASFSLELQRSIKSGRISFNTEIATLSVILNGGYIGDLFKEIPDCNVPVCFIGLPFNAELNTCKIKEVNIESSQKSLALKIMDCIAVPVPEVKALPGKKTADRLLALTFRAETLLRNRTFGFASFSGEINQNRRTIRGNINGKLAGQTIQSEISAERKRGGKVEIGGFVSECKVNVSTLSKWLRPMWEERYPLNVGGKIDFSGSWLYDSVLGFMGNLSGNCENLSSGFIGIDKNFIILNNSWNMLNGNITLEEHGSQLFGFPATFTGVIENFSSKSERKWDFSAECLNVDVDAIQKIIPFPLRYFYKIPDLSGYADFMLNITGKEPNTTLRVFSNNFISGDQYNSCAVAGSAAWMISKEFSNLEVNYNIKRDKGSPMFFRRLAFDGKELYPGKPLSLSLKLHGDPKDSMQLTGKFYSGVGLDEVESGALEGYLNKGKGKFAAVFPYGKEYRTATSDFSLFDLLLAR